MMRRTHRAALLATVAVAGVGFLTAAPASADSSCPTGHVCFWQAAGYQEGRFVTNADYIENFTQFQFSNGRNLNDAISSVKNNTSHELVLFVNKDYNDCGIGADPGCNGPYQIVKPHTSVSQVRYNDQYSSQFWQY